MQFDYFNPWTKGLRALVFCFIAIFSAEAIATSAPLAPLTPPFYAVYGIIDLLLLDYLIRRRVSSWITVYLAGMVVGYLTESFGAKVMWFGWPHSRINPLGIFPIPEFPFLIFFYHPIFSFCIPVYIARRFLACPLPVPVFRLADRLLLAWPLFPVVNLAAMRRGPLHYMAMISLDWVAFIILAGWLARSRPVSDVRFGGRGRVVLLVLLVATFVFALFKMPPFGRQVVVLPNTFQLCFSIAFLSLLGWALVRRTSTASPDRACAFDPKATQMKSLMFGALYVLVAMAAAMAAGVLAGPLIGLVARIVFISGMIGGGALFVLALRKHDPSFLVRFFRSVGEDGKIEELESS